MHTEHQSFRYKANLTLSGVFLLFLISALIRHRYPQVFYLQLLNFTFEAALVGGLADWFAVTALFRRPFGWPFHTALIPRNRDKVIEGIEHLVEENLLSSELIVEKLRGLQPTHHWANTISPGALHPATLAFSSTLRARLCTFPPKAAAGFLTKSLRNYLSGTPLTPKILPLLQSLGQTPNVIVDFALTRLLRQAASPGTKAGITRYLSSQKEAHLGDSFLNRYLFRLVESVDAVNLEEAAEAIQDELCHTLHTLYDPGHPLRQLLATFIGNVLESLSTDSSNSLEQWKTEVLLAFHWESTFSRTLATLQEALAVNEAPLSFWFDEQIAGFVRCFAENEILQRELDHTLQISLIRLAQTNHHWVGQIAKESLEDFTNADLNAFIEDKVGNDLQWIRINGSLVGGLIGFTLFLLLHFLPLLNF